MPNTHRPSISSTFGHLGLGPEEDSEDDMAITRSMTSRASQPVEVPQSLRVLRYQVSDEVHEYHIDFSPSRQLSSATKGEAQEKSIFVHAVREGEHDGEAYTIIFAKVDTITIHQTSAQSTSSRIECTCSHFTERRACEHVFWIQDQVFQARRALRSDTRNSRAQRIMLQVSESGQQLSEGRIGRRPPFMPLPAIDQLIDEIGHEYLWDHLTSQSVDEETTYYEQLCQSFQPSREPGLESTWHMYGKKACQQIANRFAWDESLQLALLDEETGIFNKTFRYLRTIETLTAKIETEVAALDASTHDEVYEDDASCIDRDVADIIQRSEQAVRVMLEQLRWRSKKVNRAALGFLFFVLGVVCQRAEPQLPNGRSRDLFGHLIRRNRNCNFVIGTIRDIPVEDNDLRSTFDECSRIGHMLASRSELETQTSPTYRYWTEWRRWTSQIQNGLRYQPS